MMSLYGRTLATLVVFAGLSSQAVQAETQPQTSPDAGTSDTGPSTLVGTKPLTSGGYGGTVMKVGKSIGGNSALGGLEGGWIINHQFAIGGAGYALAGHLKSQTDSQNRDFDLGYGGVRLEYIPLSTQLVHVDAAVLLGGGAITPENRTDAEKGSEDQSKSSANFGVVEPEVEADFNVTKYFRIGIGAGYRVVNGLAFAGVSNQDLSGLNGILALKFGAF